MDPPGFQRFEDPNADNPRPYYITVPQDGRTPRKFANARHLQDFLEKENRSDVNAYLDFDFKRRFKRKSECDDTAEGKKSKNLWSDVFDEDDHNKEVVIKESPNSAPVDGRKVNSFTFENLIKSGVHLDDKKILQDTVAELDAFRLGVDQTELEEVRLAEVRLQLINADSLKDMVAVVGSCPEGRLAMTRAVSDYFMQELLTLSSMEGPLPLSDWPNSLNSNWFSDVVRFAAIHSPLTLSLLVRLCVKEMSRNVQERHVINVATVYSQIAMMVDKKNNALTKINTLQMKLQGLTDAGIDAQALIGLGTCARNLRKDRDVLAEVQEKLLVLESQCRPTQLTLDNCDTKTNSCTVAYVQTESIDTRHLDTKPMSPRDQLSLFDVSQLDLTQPDLQPEKEHLRAVVMLSLGKELVKLIPELAHWDKVLPAHHTHPTSGKVPLEPALLTLQPPMHYQVRN